MNTEVVIFQTAVLVMQGLFMVVLFLIGRLASANTKAMSELKIALGDIVKDHARGVRDLREALDELRANALLRAEFETYRKETREVLHEFRNNFTEVAVVIGRLETKSFGGTTHLYKSD